MIKLVKYSLIISFVVVTAFFSSVVNADARCDHRERAALNAAARSVRTEFEVVYKTEKSKGYAPDTMDLMEVEITRAVLRISVYNISNEIYVTQYNRDTKKHKFIYNSDTKNGVYSFYAKDLDELVTYEYVVFSNHPNCGGERLRTYTFVQPRANPFSMLGICQGVDIPECEPFITRNVNYNDLDLNKVVHEHQERNKPPVQEDEEPKGLFAWIIKNIFYVLGGTVLIGAAVFGIVYFVRKRSEL